MRYLFLLLMFLASGIGLLFTSTGWVAAQNPTPILIGLDADMTSQAAEGGESIRRGAMVAIREINEAGGVLGRELELIVRDHRGNPTRGLDHILELAQLENLVAVLGGMHTPVALHQLKAIHENRLVYLAPWAAGTPIVDNGYEPNYVFRVSVRDALAGGFMVDYAFKAGYRKLGLLFERTGWGRSNEEAVLKALAVRGETPVGLEWFNWGVVDLSSKIDLLRGKGAEAVILVSNPREGGIAVKAMAERPKDNRFPIISHWGISGGDFFINNAEALQEIDFAFLQTFSFSRPPVPEKSEKFFESFKISFPDIKKTEDVFSPVGAAHAYDLVHLLAKAIINAGTTERSRVRDELENIDIHHGLLKTYNPPFTPDRHDALTADSFIMTRYDDQGVIRPVSNE